MCNNNSVGELVVDESMTRQGWWTWKGNISYMYSRSYCATSNQASLFPLCFAFGLDYGDGSIVSRLDSDLCRKWQGTNSFNRERKKGVCHLHAHLHHKQNDVRSKIATALSVPCTHPDIYSLVWFFRFLNSIGSILLTCVAHDPKLIGMFFSTRGWIRCSLNLGSKV